jgi:hypothetical protein
VRSSPCGGRSNGEDAGCRIRKTAFRPLEFAAKPGAETARARRRACLARCLVITAGPLSTIQPGRIGAFVPAYATAIFVTDLITAVLLFAQFAILRSRALLLADISTRR